MSQWQQMLSPSQRRQIRIIACVILVAWLIAKGIVPGWTVPHSDFSNYYVSARLVLEGAELDSLYNNQWFHDEMVKAGVNTPGKFAPFPPITALVMLPVAWLSPIHAQRVFMICNLFFVAACAYYWKKISGWELLPSVLMVIAAGLSLTNNIAFGQLYLIMTTLMLLSIIRIDQGRSWQAGIILGTLTAIKYYPIVLIGGLIALAFVEDSPRRRLYVTTILSFAVALLFLIAAQYVFFGAHIMNEYFQSSFVPHLASDLTGQGMYSMHFQSWDSLGRNLFVYDPVQNPSPWINWPAGRTIVKLTATSAVALISIAVMYVNRISPYRERIFLSVPALAALVILPASATYHYILLLLPIALLVADKILPASTQWITVALFVAIGFIPYSWFLGLADSYGTFFGYPRLWLMTLLFASVAWALGHKASPATAR
jgi:hypothetical protein